MKIFKLSLGLLAVLAYVPSAIAAATPVLGSNLSQFSVFAGIGGATNTPTEYGTPDTVTTTLSNSLGTTNTTDSGITGFWGAKQNSGPGTVSSNIGPKNTDIHQGNAFSTTTYSELTAAQNLLEGMRYVGITEFGDLSGMTLKPGVYSLSAPAYNLGVGQTVTLDGEGFLNPQWVFLATSSIIMDTDSVVSLINADAGASVYWDAVSSITMNVGATMVGNFLAQTSITMLANATISCGRALDGDLAGGGNVTMSSNTIVSSNCDNGSASGLNGIMAASADPAAAAVPEPESYTLVLAGIGVMGFLSRRRKS